MRRNRLRTYALPAAVLTAGLALRAWFILRHAVIQNDSNLYAEIASNWFHFHTYGFSTDTLPRPTLIRLPGYPMFLIACTGLLGWLFGSDSFTPTLVIQLLLDLASCVLVALTVRSVFHRANAPQSTANRAAITVLSAASLCPFTANYVATPLTECPVNFTIALAFFSFERYLSTRSQRLQPSQNKKFSWPLLALGGATATSLLLRPDQLMLAAAFVIALLTLNRTQNLIETTPLARPTVLQNALESRLRRRMRALTKPRSFARSVRETAGANILPTAILIAITVLPLVPWTVRNYRTFSVFQPLAPKSATDPGEKIPTGFQHWYRSWAMDFSSTEEFYWKYPDEPLDAGALPNRAFSSDSQFDQTVDLIADSNEAGRYNAEIDQRFQQLADQRRASDPLSYYLLLPVGRTLNMLFHPRNEMWATDLRWWQLHKHPAQTIWATLAAVLSAAYLVAGALGFYRARRLFPGLCAPLITAATAFFLLRCAVLFMLDNAEQRYTIEFFPLAFLGIGLLLLPGETSADALSISDSDTSAIPSLPAS